MRILSILMFLLFMICIALQYNDPDPYLWMPIYAIPAFLSLLYFFRRGYLWVTLLAGVIYIIGAIYWCPPLASVPGNIFDNEEVREAGGLLIAGVWMSLLSLASKSYRGAGVPARQPDDLVAKAGTEVRPPNH